ncbi:MAG: MBL fold metallo-hydrolase [Acidimicrobiales bacterium]
MSATLDWYGCATFRFRVAGLTIFLDAYIDRVPAAAGPRTADGDRLRADDVDACDWIVVGHSHFDHLYGAERIMANTDARLIAGYESIRVMESAGVPLDRMIPVAGGETIELGGGVTVSVVPSQHSCVWSHAAMGPADEVCLGDLGVTWQEQQARLADLGRHLASLGDDTRAHLARSAIGHSTRGDGGALVFLFETPDGSLLYQDTSGHWSGVLRDLRPDVALLAAAGRGNIDGEPIQGSLARFVARQVDLLRPSAVVLTHHDDWLPGFSTPTDIEPIRAELALTAPRVDLVELGYLDGTEVLPR